MFTSYNSGSETTILADFDAHTCDYNSDYLEYSNLNKEISIKYEANWPTELGKHAALLYKNTAKAITVQKDIIVCKFEREVKNLDSAYYTFSQLA